jgi:predicted amidohydrolase
MESARHLAAAQTVPIAGDVGANIHQHLELIEAAAAERVTLLVFPELSLTGYELARGPALAFDAEDGRLEPLRAAACAHEMTLVVGAPLRLQTGLHIGASVIEPSGCVHLYTKVHLGAFQPQDPADSVVPPPEQAFFTPGSLNPIVGWQGRTFAVSICADSRYPSHAQAASDLGANVYLSCQFAISAHMAFKQSRLKDVARRHGLTVVFSNYGGPTGGLAACGGSCVRIADGTAVVRLPATGRGLAIASESGTRWTGKTVMLDPIEV